ncbi:hypothetical protein XELAEV_18044445mg [Xenopus laevis]|uniref:Uncharacterized protein n=1 Tax=Xenopus laevis TaxID=8355 RepID=A0A974H3A7_XENLA|nr:hypothetical protein XELAEV_18044445mg [Xenopus laevis]
MKGRKTEGSGSWVSTGWVGVVVERMGGCCTTPTACWRGHIKNMAVRMFQCCPSYGDFSLMQSCKSHCAVSWARGFPEVMGQSISSRCPLGNKKKKVALLAPDKCRTTRTFTGRSDTLRQNACHISHVTEISQALLQCTTFYFRPSQYPWCSDEVTHPFQSLGWSPLYHHAVILNKYPAAFLSQLLSLVFLCFLWQYGCIARSTFEKSTVIPRPLDHIMLAMAHFAFIEWLK